MMPVFGTQSGILPEALAWLLWEICMAGASAAEMLAAA